MLIAGLSFLISSLLRKELLYSEDIDTCTHQGIDALFQTQPDGESIPLEF